MGVSTDGVVVHLAWVACWVVEKLLGLVTAVARVDSAKYFHIMDGIQ